MDAEPIAGQEACFLCGDLKPVGDNPLCAECDATEAQKARDHHDELVEYWTVGALV